MFIKDVKLYKIIVQASDSGIPYNKSILRVLDIFITDDDYYPSSTDDITLIELRKIRDENEISEKFLSQTSSNYLYFLIGILITISILTAVGVILSIICLHVKQKRRETQTREIPKHISSQDSKLIVSSLLSTFPVQMITTGIGENSPPPFLAQPIVDPLGKK